MARHIEMLEPAWASQEVHDYVEQLRAEIAKAMTIPEWAMREPSAYARAQRNAWAATEIMRREVVRLVSEYSMPRMLLLTDGQSDGEK